MAIHRQASTIDVLAAILDDEKEEDFFLLHGDLNLLNVRTWMNL